MNVSLQSELELLVAAAEAAAEMALSFFRNDAKVWTKAGHSPVSEADIAIDHLLHDRLLEARPGYGYLSEETEDDGSRLVVPRTFIVDPIDGTRGFISGTTDWTIPIAVVEAGRPIAAVLIAPAREELYQAILGGGTYRDGERTEVSRRKDLDGATLAVSQRLLRSASVSDRARAKSVFHASLAYRLARVADGRSDGAAIKANARDWDLAAADLLVREAGGQLTYLDGKLPRYDRPETDHGPMVAGPPALCPLLARLTASALEQGL